MPPPRPVVRHESIFVLLPLNVDVAPPDCATAPPLPDQRQSLKTTFEKEPLPVAPCGWKRASIDCRSFAKAVSQNMQTPCRMLSFPF